MKRDWDKFIFTEASNPVKIHEVMSAFIREKPDAVFLLDYNWCIWNDKLKDDIKRRTKNNSWLVYIKYNPKIKTYDFFDWTTKEPLWGKRPYIWNGITMMTKEVEWLVWENKRQAELEAATNKNYVQLSNNLERNFAEQIAMLKNKQLTRSSTLYDELHNWNWKGEKHQTLLRDFLVYTETRLDDVVKKWRANGKLNKDNPIDTWSGIFNARFVTSNWKTEVPLFLEDPDWKRWAERGWVPEYLYDYMSSRDVVLKEYITNRLLAKRWTFSHMERRDQSVDFDTTQENVDEKQMEKIKKKKELRLYWMDKLLQMVDKLEEIDSNTPPELVAFSQFIESVRNDIAKAPENKIPSESSWMRTIKEAQDLFINYKNNDWNWASMTDTTAKNLIEQIFKAESRSKIQQSISELWVNMTLFDNSSREWVVQDIVDDATDANQSYYQSKKNWDNISEWLEAPSSILNEEYDKCFQNICRLSYVDVDEKTWEIKPQENKDFIDWLMWCSDIFEISTYLIDNGIISQEIVNKNKSKFTDFAIKIHETLENKRKMLSEFKLTSEDLKKKYEEEIEELKRKPSLNDEEMARMALLMWLVENDEALSSMAGNQTEVGKTAIFYSWVDSLLHEVITPYLIKEWWWLKWENADIHNDSKWLRGWRDWTDENCEKIGPVLKEILIEVAVTALAIGVWAFTWWLWAAAVMWLRATAAWARAISIWNKIAKFTRITKLCKTLGTWSKKIEAYWRLLRRSNTRLWKAFSRATTHWAPGESTIARNLWWRMATLSETSWGKIVVEAAEWARWTKLWKAGKTIWEIARIWNVERAQGSLWMKAVWFISEWFWFHVSSTAMHNAINWENLLTWLNPFWYMEGPNWEKISNFRWYVESVAFLWVLKCLGKPIND